MYAFEEPGEVSDLDAVQPAFEQTPQRQYAAALLPHRDDDFANAEALDQVLDGSDLRQHAIGGDHRFLHLFQRIESDHLQSRRICVVERGLDYARFRARTQYQHPMRQQRRDQRADHGVAHDDQTAEGHDEDGPEYFLEDFAVRQQKGKQVRGRNAEQQREKYPADVRDEGQFAVPPIKSDPAIQANDEDGKGQGGHCESFERGRMVAMQAYRQDDDQEQTGQIGTQPQQRCAGDVLTQQTNHGDPIAEPLPRAGYAIADMGYKNSLANCS